MLDRLSGQIEERLGNAVFSFAGETMEEVVGLKLSLGGYTLSVAESCTGGLLAQRMTDVPGSSKYFIEGVVAYANDAKTRTLGVEPMLLLEHGAVSAPVAEAMAEGIRKRSGTRILDYRSRELPARSGGTEEKPVGTVFIALASDVKTEHRKLNLPGDRQSDSLARLAGRAGSACDEDCCSLFLSGRPSVGALDLISILFTGRHSNRGRPRKASLQYVLWNLGSLATTARHYCCLPLGVDSLWLSDRAAQSRPRYS